VAVKYAKNVLAVVVLPRTPLGELTTLPTPHLSPFGVSTPNSCLFTREVNCLTHLPATELQYHVDARVVLEETVKADHVAMSQTAM